MRIDSTGGYPSEPIDNGDKNRFVSCGLCLPVFRRGLAATSPPHLISLQKKFLLSICGGHVSKELKSIRWTNIVPSNTRSSSSKAALTFIDLVSVSWAGANISGDAKFIVATGFFPRRCGTVSNANAGAVLIVTFEPPRICPGAARRATKDR
ncbi:hypothetical protein MTP99_016641 [Tenebrio molitor]|nr:hypothetical protein MTP99_016641 [Tenebrio molitor]